VETDLTSRSENLSCGQQADQRESGTRAARPANNASKE
jgi:hypothetical protein